MQYFDSGFYADMLEKDIKDFLLLNQPKGELAIIQIGHNTASEKYVALKQKFCARLTIKTQVYALADTLTDEEIASEVSSIFGLATTTGGIIQLPLPRPSLKSVLDLIPSDKDIDLLSSTSLNQFYSGNFSKLSPVVRATHDFMQYSRLDYENLRVVFIGRGDLVGRPLEWFFASKGAQTSVVDNYKTGDKLSCDVFILSAGVPNLVNGQDISAKTHIIDFGSSVVDNKTVGDLNLDSELEHVGTVSPSPKGMGPSVVRYLVKNFLGI